VFVPLNVRVPVPVLASASVPVLFSTPLKVDVASLPPTVSVGVPDEAVTIPAPLSPLIVSLTLHPGPGNRGR